MSKLEEYQAEKKALTAELEKHKEKKVLNSGELKSLVAAVQKDYPELKGLKTKEILVELEKMAGHLRSEIDNG